MDAKSWVVPATFAVIIAIPMLAFFGYMIREQLLAHKNRAYKTLAEHSILNASDRSTWMSGVMAQEGNHEVDRFSSRIAPIAQLVTLAVLTIVVLVWNDALVTENTKQEARLGQLELQVHALALSTPAPSTVAPQVSENAISPNVGLQTNGGTPMQQACANLIGRVADAYEKGESSKIALSLEELVQKLGCHNTPTP